MERYIIAGPRKLVGKVRASGAKNAVLPVMAATVLTRHCCIIHDVPYLKDVYVMSDILQTLGCAVELMKSSTEGNSLIVDPIRVVSHEVPEELMRQMRSSIFLMGPLLARLGRVKVSYPGGCAIGPRPIDLHLRGLRALGATITERAGYIVAETDGLRGCEIHLDFPSVGATENIMMAAVLAKGTTIIRNAAKEPEITELQNFLNAMGAKVKGAGTDLIRVEGVDELGPAEHTVIPDRIEVGTFMVGAALTGGCVEIINCIPEHVQAVTAKLREAGAKVTEGKSTITVEANDRPLAIDIKTLPYPGFPTDMQPQIMALMCIANGTSVITETIFESRFKHAEEFRRMGAKIRTEGRVAVVKGVPSLSGASVEVSDLRGGAALVLAGIAAEGVSVIEDIHHIERGYEKFDEKLRGLGAAIERSSR
ncbi:MAG TPA: UDP-N-acetylglucosamine 1-carboxyvinyltransferase [Firmicutes bacterium]|nr:UDP-N-acetylglucosamine 1-carboxyvinyltransferase [Bacillota bacterium]